MCANMSGRSAPSGRGEKLQAAHMKQPQRPPVFSAFIYLCVSFNKDLLVNVVVSAQTLRNKHFPEIWPISKPSPHMNKNLFHFTLEYKRFVDAAVQAVAVTFRVAAPARGVHQRQHAH